MAETLRDATLFGDASGHHDAGARAFERSERTEPRLWVCRLVIVECLEPMGGTIREVEFRRGLNIIAAEEAMRADTEPVGHSVGKTLLIRLLRYCLGDTTFCTRSTRAAITQKWEHGYVLAHMRVEGEDWVVARPIGIDRGATSSFAARSSDLDTVRTDSADRLPFGELVQRLEALVEGAFAGFELPHVDRQDRQARWTDFLGWLIRDQHCRYRHHAEWRDPESEAGVATLAREDAALIIRMSLGLFEPEERELAARHRRMLTERETAERERADVEAFLEREGKAVARLVHGMDASLPGAVLAEGARQHAAHEVERLQRLREEQDSTLQQHVAAAEQALKERIEARARVEEQVTRLRGDIEATRTQLEQLEVASTDQFYASYESVAGPYCRFYTTKADADGAGCPGRNVALPVGQRDPRHERKIAETREHEQRLGAGLSDLETAMAERRREEESAAAALSSARGRRLHTMRGIDESIGQARERESRAKDLRDSWEELERLNRRIETLREEIETSREVQQTLRAALEDRRRRLSDRFESILQHLLGPKAGGEIRIDGHGIAPVVAASVAVGGEAMATSATVLGFDLACLLYRHDDAACIPGFLCHDSPREADMEAQIYYRLFHLLHEMERGAGPHGAGFQYIISTTSPPPSEMASPFVRVVLSAREPKQRLLRQEF